MTTLLQGDNNEKAAACACVPAALRLRPECTGHTRCASPPPSGNHCPNRNHPLVLGGYGPSPAGSLPPGAGYLSSVPSGCPYPSYHGRTDSAALRPGAHHAHPARRRRPDSRQHRHAGFSSGGRGPIPANHRRRTLLLRSDAPAKRPDDTSAAGEPPHLHDGIHHRQSPSVRRPGHLVLLHRQRHPRPGAGIRNSPHGKGTEL